MLSVVVVTHRVVEKHTSNVIEKKVVITKNKIKLYSAS